MNSHLHAHRMEKRLLGQNELIKGLLVSRPLRRLQKVSFLGAIDYAVASDPLRLQRTRYHHSLCVASLVDEVSLARGYGQDTREHLVAAALLHDIGHMPLSHSAEAAMKARLSVDHHEAGLRVLAGDWHDARIFARWLATRFDRQRLMALIAGDSLGGDGFDLFSHPINVDTIDGILRSAELAGMRFAWSSKEVAAAAFLRADEARLNVLDDFWQLKDRVYRDLIHSPMGVITDTLAQQTVSGTGDVMTESAVRATDLTWRKRWPVLFRALRAWQRSSPADITYTARQYITGCSADVHSRYIVKKQNKTYTAEWLRCWLKGYCPADVQGGEQGDDGVGRMASYQSGHRLH